MAGWVSLSWMAALSDSVRMSPNCLRWRRDQVLQRGGGEEELLAQPQLLAGIALVAGIEHARDGLGADPLALRAFVVAAVERVEMQRRQRAGGPEPERVGVPRRRRR